MDTRWVGHAEHADLHLEHRHVEQVGRVVREYGRRQRPQVQDEHEQGDPRASEDNAPPRVAFATVERQRLTQGEEYPNIEGFCWQPRRV